MYLTERLLSKTFNQSDIKAIAKAFGDTSDGLTGSEIAHFLQQAKISDIEPNATKWIRLHNAFCNSQNSKGNRIHILAFIRFAMKPANFIGNSNKYEILQSNLNIALSFSGLEVKDTGELIFCEKTSTLTEAESRANQLKLKLKERDIHPDVLRFCRAELLQNNYFHAVLEAVKSVFDKLRQLSGLTEDGHELANKCLGGVDPKLSINSFKTKSEK